MKQPSSLRPWLKNRGARGGQRRPRRRPGLEGCERVNRRIDENGKAACPLIPEK